MTSTPPLKRSAVRSERYSAEHPDRAVIDIGSNTVRMVIYSGPKRAPEVWMNEKVNARLGRDVARTGRMPDKAMQTALAALARYRLLLDDIGVTDVQTVATAAVRDAENGAEFLEQVRALGLSPRLLSGKEEALTSALGIIGAFPGAKGTVADLGGGSLELVKLDESQCSEATSLPLGTLMLPQLAQDGPRSFDRAVTQALGSAGWAVSHPGPLYMVGGTWRALATYAMRKADHPLTDPHGFSLSREEAADVAQKIAEQTPEKLAAVPGISKSRADGLPKAAALLGLMLEELEPDRLIFSSWGLREGLLLQRLDPLARAQDPLITGISNFIIPRGGSATLATQIAAWSAQAAAYSGPTDRASERLRLAAIMLSFASARLEPNLRRHHAYNWAMDKRWVSIEPRGRAMIAATLSGACGDTKLPSDLDKICEPLGLRQATAWGLAVRLCRRMGAGSRVSLMTTSLTVADGRLILRMDASRAPLVNDAVRRDLKALAQWLELEPVIYINPQEQPTTETATNL